MNRKASGASGLSRKASFQKDYTIKHDMFQVVREGKKEILENLLNEERNGSATRWSGFTFGIS